MINKFCDFIKLYSRQEKDKGMHKKNIRSEKCCTEN